ncbi:Protein ILITYHIA [Gracilariopsis chorda]|uniref:Protein ILITYHIA n=1 Tax=Gracilariopsis chorda TaxID=448386 RepID=A0A2V3J6G2_9FLOR|nr:Protein ILITYHIA [Gracilariopsis chorda]|eukprot:PXF50016.1 Protein ILITYHIA [Gracilariopsis chorda]
MADEGNIKQKIRLAVSQDAQTSLAALRDLKASLDKIPPAAIPHLLTRVPTSTYQHLGLIFDILQQTRLDGVKSLITKKLNAFAASFRRAPPSTREALNVCKLCCRLLENEHVRASALELLIVTIAALEASPAPPQGAQHRSKTKAIRIAYEKGTKAVSSVLTACKSNLFEFADGFAKAPFEALASLGLLAPSYSNLSASERERYIKALATLCMKAAKIAQDLVRVSSSVLSQADQDLVIENVLPIVDHALKRETKLALPAAVSLFRAIQTFDISKGVSKTILPTLQQAVKNSDEEMRSNGVRMSQALGFCIKNEELLLSTTETQISALKTARYGYQKTATVEAIAAMVCASTRSETVYVKVLEGIYSWLSAKKERSADVRCAGFQALVSILLEVPKDLGSLDIVQKCVGLLTDGLCGKQMEDDRKAVLVAMSADIPRRCISESLMTSKSRDILEKIAAECSTKSKQDEALRSLAVLATWDLSRDVISCNLRSQANAVLGDRKSSPVLQDPSVLTSLSETRCAITCCEWMVETGHKFADLGIEAIYKHSLDPRPQVSRKAVDKLQAFQKSTDLNLITQMLTVLWETQFKGAPGEVHVARSYDFDDGMRAAERLGQAVLATVLPNIPMKSLPTIALATNHPRLYSTPTDFRPRKSSRFWLKVSEKLQDVDSNYNPDADEDWLNSCLAFLVGTEGIHSDNHAQVRAAVNSICALADPMNSYSTRVLRHVTKCLQPSVAQVSNLTETHFEALKFVKEVENSQAKVTNASDDPGVVNKKKTARKHLTSASRHSRQAKQAEADKARAAAASASALADKLKVARGHAKEADRALRNAKNILILVSDLAAVAPHGIHDLMSTALSLVLPVAKVEMLEEPCRRAISALTRTVNTTIKSIDEEISSCLYSLEQGQDAHKAVSRLVVFFQELSVPALGAEDFACVLPIIRAALLRNPSEPDQNQLSRRSGVKKRREEVAIVKAAAQVLLRHCKPEAVDAAVAAAAWRAGTWIIEVLEREDGAFAPAADALAFLTGTALSPGSDALSQVFEGMVSGKSSVRDAVLASLSRLPPLSSPTIDCPRDAALGRMLFLATFDPDNPNMELGNELWENYNHPLSVHDDAPILIELIRSDEADVRQMSAKAVATALCGKENEATRNECLRRLFEIYDSSLPNKGQGIDQMSTHVRKGIHPPVKRVRDRSIPDESEDEKWMAREGVALALEHMALKKALTPIETTIAFSFLAGKSLGDENKTVREGMSKAAMAVVEAAGEHGPSLLLPMIEKQLNTPVSSGMTQDEILHADRTRENLVMCLGSVAGFLPANDDRVAKIAKQVIKSAMETPSEVVQNAAARCLAPLAKAAVSCDGDKTQQVLIKTVWNEDSSYGERRGAAYALAGIAGGLGLKFLKKSNLMTEIEAAVKDKSPRRRQGAFILLETHAIMLERLFEPYTVAIVPFLLSCMGDSIVEVRNACWAAAQASMTEISSQGVKMILPSLLTGLQDRQWRTKAGSAEVLGAMAFCAPRQLAQCLPQVVPKLAEALADAHPKVVNAAESAVNRIAAVVRSPEVRKLSPFLLAALRDPAGRTRGAVDAMLGSEFIHAIDAASLALLIPPLHRGLRDRNSELKKHLRITLLDAIPDVRRTSAKALGALAASLGEQGLGDIVSWLVSAILGGSGNTGESSSDRGKNPSAIVSSSAERSGAAMGLAEVAASMNDRRLDEVLGSILMAGESSAEAREGGLMVIASMPSALGERYEGRLSTSLTAILKGLSDDADSVREAALAAGRNLVTAYAKSSLDHLLPEILSAMREKLWRIRQAATQLLGDMLLVIAGAMPENPSVTGLAPPSETKKDDLDGSNANGSEDGDDGNHDEDEDFESPEHAAAAMTTEATMKAIEEVLGIDRRNEVLAALYIIRCDVSVRVRQTGLQVWKSVVANTPRVLREIIPCAVRQIVDGLGDEDEERRAASGRTLSDLSQKLGDRVVPEVLPALRSGICNKDASARIRRGACEGLGELVSASPKIQLEEHSDALVDTVHQALFDSLPIVRMVAADVFALLLKPLGTMVVDAIVPKVIELLSSNSAEAETALDSLKLILKSCGPGLTSIVVPRLVSQKPLQTASCRAITTAANVAQNGFEPYVSDVVDAVVDTLEELGPDDDKEPVEEILGAIGDGGIETRKLMLDTLFTKFNEGYPERRVAASCAVLGFCRRSSVESVTSCSGSLLEILVRQLADTDDGAARAAWEALNVMSTVVPNESLMGHIPVIRQSLRAASTGIAVTDTTSSITALQMPKGVAPFVPMLTAGLLNGSPELREQSALGIGELVEFSSTKSLGAFAIKLAGALIRVISGRFPWQVKAAILKALLALQKKGGMMLRSFVPQLQSTFVKCLSDNSRLVRVRACAALGALVSIQPRLEPLLNELVNIGLNGVNGGAQTAGFHSLSQVFKLAKKVADSAFTSTASSITEAFAEEDSEVRDAAGRSLGVLAGRCSGSMEYCRLMDLVVERLVMEGTEYTDRVSCVKAMAGIFKSGKHVDGLQWDDIVRFIEPVYELFDSGIGQIRGGACTAMGSVLLLAHEGGSKLGAEMDAKRRAIMRLCESAEFDEEAEVRMAGLRALREIVRTERMVVELCAESVIACAGASNTGVRECAERVLKRMVIGSEDMNVDEEQMEVLRECVGAEDLKLVERRLGKLRTLGESEDERD